MEFTRTVTREVTLDATTDEVWRLLADADELATWVGDEVRVARVDAVEHGSRIAWTWAPDGVASEVELTLTEVGERTVVRVVERATGASSSARACAVGDAWDDRLLGLELRCLTRAWARV